jgi:hypothetical protein
MRRPLTVVVLILSIVLGVALALRQTRTMKPNLAFLTGISLAVELALDLGLKGFLVRAPELFSPSAARPREANAIR